MNCLGIESTAHTFGVGIIKKRQIVANQKRVFTTAKGGMVPAEVADHHARCCDLVIKEALNKAGMKISEIDLISYSQSPGIGHMLNIGAFVARSLSSLHKIPIIGVNHCIAHLEIGRLLTKAKDPVLLYASGANTQIIAYEAGRYRIFGETLDIGVGNFLDSFARFAGLGFPGGPKIYDLSLKSKTYVELPYAVKGMDVSFGGMLTNLKQKLAKHPIEDLAYSLQETAFAMLVEVSERAMAHCNKDELLLGGGVACNIRLKEMCEIMCKQRGAKAYFLDNEYNVDNGAMIAWQGILEYRAGKRLDVRKAGIDPYLRTDEIEINWR